MPEEDETHPDNIYEGDLSELSEYKLPSQQDPKIEDLISDQKIDRPEQQHQVSTSDYTGGKIYSDRLEDLDREMETTDIEISADMSAKEVLIRQTLLKGGYLKVVKKGPQEFLEVGDKFKLSGGKKYAVVPYAGGTILATPDVDNSIYLAGSGIGHLRIKHAVSYQYEGKRDDYPPQMNWYPGAGKSYPFLGPDNSGIDYSNCGVTIIRGASGGLEFRSGKRENWPKISQKLDKVISLIGVSTSGK